MATTHSAVEYVKLKKQIKDCGLKDALQESIKDFGKLEQEQYNNIMKLLITKNTGVSYEKN